MWRDSSITCPSRHIVRAGWSGLGRILTRHKTLALLILAYLMMRVAFCYFFCWAVKGTATRRVIEAWRNKYT